MLNLDLLSKTPRLWRSGLFLALCTPLALAPLSGCSDDPVEPPPREPGGPTLTGLDLPNGFLDWPVLGVATRTDNGTIRVITGNSTAIEAARSGNNAPWPDGSAIADMVWAQGTNPDWDEMIAPDGFGALAYMVKNAAAYADDGGWKYGLWAGADLLPSDDPEFDRDCVQCHLDEAPNNDFVFTRIMPLPDLNVVAAPAPNGIEAPTGWQDWAVIGVADRTDNGTIRVITGNSIAVEAARAGNTDPWPDGSEIADLVWPDNTNPDFVEMNAPGEFAALAYMIKDAAAYPDAGGWAYGLWTGPNMEPAAADFDLECIQCHLDETDNDAVFTRVANLPTLP